MPAGDWSYLAGRLVGDGTVDIFDTDLQLNLKEMSQTLSAPSMISAAFTTEMKNLKANGRPIFVPNNTVIIAEASGLMRAMGIYRKPTFNGNMWEFTATGLSSYPTGMPYDGSVSFIGADPLDIVRECWNHLQSRPGGNLGVTIDPLRSPVQVGTVAEDVRFTTGAGESVAFEAGPRKLNWWTTHDLGRTIDDYAKETPFDWLEKVYWEGDQPHCHIALGYPTIGGRRDDLSFTLGANLASIPTIAEGDSTNQVIVLGAGEGREQVRGYAAVSDGKIRQVKVVEEKALQSEAQANARASQVLAQSRGELIVESLEVYDHPDARLEAIEMGVEVQLYAETDHALVDQYVRVVGISRSPEKSDRATITVVRAGA